MTRTDGFLLLGALLTVLGTGRLLLTRDLVRRVLALNVAGAGVMMILLTLAGRARPTEPDPVAHALVLTSIVIMVSVTGLALVLVGRVEERADGPPGDGPPADGDGPAGR